MAVSTPKVICGLSLNLEDQRLSSGFLELKQTSWICQPHAGSSQRGACFLQEEPWPVLPVPRSDSG